MLKTRMVSQSHLKIEHTIRKNKSDVKLLFFLGVTNNNFKIEMNDWKLKIMNLYHQQTNKLRETFSVSGKLRLDRSIYLRGLYLDFIFPPKFLTIL